MTEETKITETMTEERLIEMLMERNLHLKIFTF
jgi:hypothetical protein